MANNHEEGCQESRQKISIFLVNNAGLEKTRGISGDVTEADFDAVSTLNSKGGYL